MRAPAPPLELDTGKPTLHVLHWFPFKPVTSEEWVRGWELAGRVWPEVFGLVERDRLEGLGLHDLPRIYAHDTLSARHTRSAWWGMMEVWLLDPRSVTWRRRVRIQLPGGYDGLPSKATWQRRALGVLGAYEAPRAWVVGRPGWDSKVWDLRIKGYAHRTPPKVLTEIWKKDLDARLTELALCDDDLG